VKFPEHIKFHFSSKSNGDVQSPILPLNGPKRGKEGKQALKCPNVDKFPQRQEEEAPKVEKWSKEFLALVDAFHVFVIQQGEATTQN